MDHFSTVHTSFIRECMAVNSKILCLNYLDYQNDIRDMIGRTNGKLIVIDNADILLNDLESKKFCTTKKPGDPSKFLTYPAASELFALSANLAVFP